MDEYLKLIVQKLDSINENFIRLNERIERIENRLDGINTSEVIVDEVDYDIIDVDKLDVSLKLFLEEFEIDRYSVANQRKDELISVFKEFVMPEIVQKQFYSLFNQGEEGIVQDEMVIETDNCVKLGISMKQYEDLLIDTSDYESIELFLEDTLCSLSDEDIENTINAIVEIGYANVNIEKVLKLNLSDALLEVLEKISSKSNLDYDEILTRLLT